MGPTSPAVAVIALVLTWGRDLGPVPVVIVPLVLAGAVPAAARDTVFAAVMITTNGILGVALLVGDDHAAADRPGDGDQPGPLVLLLAFLFLAANP